MNPNPEPTQEGLLKARQALQKGDRQAARHWAETAAALSPELEEAWLILAAVASPRASVAYLERALKINPESVRARKGMHWAVDRLRRLEKSQAHRIQSMPAGTARYESSSTTDTQPMKRLLPKTVAATVPAQEPLASKGLARYRWSALALIAVAFCLTIAWVVWPGNTAPVRAFLHVPQSTAGLLGASVDVSKPTYTYTFTSTFTPTDTFTATPTETLTSTPTDTPIPTQTPVPTQMPLPTDTPLPAPTDVPYAYPDNGGTRWIDVDLSQQMLYAYEGDTIVASFLVSTGVPAFPTVTGQYHIYIKLVSTLMAGDGYYLPNVPYTMYFYKGYGIHGTYWHNNFGHPMSHGCVNMYTPDAEWMFYWASVGTLVNIHY